MTRFMPLLFLICCRLAAQPAFNPSVPPPKQILGYELGNRFSSHNRLEQYLSAVRDAAQDRVRFVPYGETYEGRKLYLAILSSPENLSRLDEIKSHVHKLADPRTITDSEAEQIIKNSPAVVWLSYGVHGNEASSPEAALSVLYQLAARTDNETTSLLKNLVIIIDPLLNPDGHERYVNFQTVHSGTKPVEDKNADEHNEDWPSGRTNHYFFDLNRDWTWLTQKESQARIRTYQEWKPQVHVDFHEMSYNSSYFFFPAAKPINTNLPKSVIEWGQIYGKANAAAFDTMGWSYYSRESFDLLYPGYGDSWPSLSGAIGMTYEQAGGVGIRVKRADENILTLKDRIDRHTATSWATLKATELNREKRLRDFYSFFKEAINEGKSGPVR
ncbi:MAG: M14 metallopeptidase family protein, partial [Bacteroidota bacterium]